MQNLLASLLACPRCRAPVALNGASCTCEGCGASYPLENGIPRMADAATERDQRLAAEWGAQHHAHPLYNDQTLIANHWQKLVLPRLLGRIAQVEGPVLDLGCGIGPLGAVLGERGLQISLVGLDFQGELLEDARVGYAARVEGDVHRLPLREGSFSAAISANTLHHSPDPLQALREVARVLRPGGRLIAWDPRELWPLELIKKALRREDDAFAETHRAFRPGEYRTLLEEAGFIIEEARSRDTLAPLVANGLDLFKLGRFGVTRPIAHALSAVDQLIARLDLSGELGLMVIAEARKP